MEKIALITGINGQDGSYLSELLLDLDYKVYGIIRRSSQNNLDNLKHILNRINLLYGDLQDSESIKKIIIKVNPTEIYNLAAMSDVRISYDIPSSTMEINTIGYLKILEAVLTFNSDIKIYQACSSEMFGKVLETPQKETTPFYPRSPYGVSKAASFYIGRSYREAYGLNIYNGILFNHESPRRGEKFLSRKVVKAAVRIKLGLQDRLTLGNLNSSRDWGYAKEYVRWIHAIMQATPDDYIICTGETHTVKEFVEETFSQLDMDWQEYVDYDDSLKRPAEVDLLLGDYSKSKKVLGFEPKVKFKELITIMIGEEIKNES